MEKKVVAFVPVKLNNERLPGKNTKQFRDGTPLIANILTSLLSVSGLDDVYVYCSNESVVDYIPDNCKYLKRSVNLDRSETKINEVLQSFARDVEADIYVLAHATAPFISSVSIQAAVDAVVSGEYDSALTVSRLQEFLWKDGRPINYSLNAVPRTQDLDPMFVETTGLYVYTRGLIMERNVRIGDRPHLVEVSKIEAVDINEPVDFEIADALHTYGLKGRV